MSQLNLNTWSPKSWMRGFSSDNVAMIYDHSTKCTALSLWRRNLRDILRSGRGKRRGSAKMLVGAIVNFCAIPLPRDSQPVLCNNLMSLAEGQFSNLEDCRQYFK